MATTRQQREETVSMEDTTLAMPTATLASLGRMLLTQLDPDSARALVAAIREEIGAEVKAEALATARAELAEAVQTAQERSEARLAAYQARLDQEYESREEAMLDRARRQARHEVETALEEARTAAAEGQQHAAEAAGPLVALVRALLPEGRKTYLGRVGIQELDVDGLNVVLRRAALAIHHDLPSQEFTDLVVNIHTDEGKWEAATRFWLEAYAPPEEPVDLVSGIPWKHIVGRRG